MKKITNYIADMLLYGGVGKENFNKIREKIREVNRYALILFSSIVGVGMGILLILSFFIEVLESSRASYIICVSISIVMFLIAVTIAKKLTVLTTVCVHLFMCLMLAFGILLGTVVEPNQASASFGILMFAVPLLFTNVPLAADFEVVASIIVYIFAAKATQSPEMFSFNMSVVLPYGAACLILCALIMNTKITGILLNHRNKLLSECDQLTGMFNRRSYDMKLHELIERDGEFDLTFCVFDINGLKHVNDTLGHKAGDELICAAANAITEVYGKYGPCYRTGGDEFFAIIDNGDALPELLAEEFEKKCGEFSGVLVKKLSVSVGYVSCLHSKDVADAVHTADNRMYVQKDIYYGEK